MEHVSNKLTDYTDKDLKTLLEQYEENKQKLLDDLDLHVDDLVIFRKKELSKVAIVGKILSICDKTIHVKTFLSIKGIDEFYLDIQEVKPYDTTSHSKHDQKT